MNAATKDVLRHTPYILKTSATLGGCISALAFCAFGLCGVGEHGFTAAALHLALICAGVAFAVIFLASLFLCILLRYLWKS